MLFYKMRKVQKFDKKDQWPPRINVRPYTTPQPYARSKTNQDYCSTSVLTYADTPKKQLNNINCSLQESLRQNELIKTFQFESITRR